MATTSRTSTILTVATIAVGGLAAYAIYFDYKRRTDGNFRRKLRKDKKRIVKSQASSETSKTGADETEANDLRGALEKVRAEEMPTNPEEREKYFMAQVSIGEQLCAQGPVYNLPAAMCFYRAFRVYPSPVELIVIYQKTVPEPVFKVFSRGFRVRLSVRKLGYYNFFPPKSMNVAVENLDVPDGTGRLMRKKILVANKDIAAGEVIYKEGALVTALDLDLQGKGTHCSHCLREIGDGTALRPDSDRLNSVYCSNTCQLEAKLEYQSLLFTLEPPLPVGLTPDVSDSAQEDRDAAQKAFVAYLNHSAKASPELVAKFIARQVSIETSKMVPGGQPVPTPALADGGDYTLYDHLERLRFLEVKPGKNEMKLLGEVLQTALPGLEQFVTEERHGTLLGKMAYNSYGVFFGNGRDDKPEPKERPEDVEKTRTPLGTARQVGAAFYAVSSYISHSCAPSARPSFDDGNAELHLIATRDLKKGDEITVSYIDVAQHEDETTVDARRRRRMELARGWRFACPCTRCAEEAAESGQTSEESAPRDESKVEPTVSRAEESDIPKP
ncbi:hypothetical protein SERLA73DRAFT_117876 [Serpula lacrymans var. lacrymans S7.3]|uniref:SET domain-containing protein n=1 Tax=Serpula lacrymans var. lacrymans (strain S7.3) TaxID=936435 RepID=F8QI30_SERL3|nr:hypothetical protein SERLA73DRAFT_117876 [Serpula lacrymans var. lacrymans S7.3]